MQDKNIRNCILTINMNEHVIEYYKIKSYGLMYSLGMMIGKATNIRNETKYKEWV
jgi:hypothetical protein